MRWLLAAALLAPVSARAAQKMYAQNWRNELRAGPSVLAPSKGLLDKGTPVLVAAARDGWARVEIEGLSAGELWIAESALGPQPPRAGLLDALRGRAALKRFVPVTAAVRGFAVRHGRAKPASVKALEAVAEPAFTAEDLAAFRQQGGLKAAAGERVLERYAPTEAEAGVGLGVASAVAARGLAGDRAGLRYLNLLAAALAEGSGAYATRFRVLVSAGTETNAVSAPGGWIFVTRPLLKACRDEAELAAVLAHEMAHIIGRHGLKEMKQREVQTRAEEAVAELDEAAGEGDPEMAEHDALADAAYDVIHKPRLLSYEEEADRGAALLLARAGYDPAAVPRMIERVGAAAAGKDDRPAAGSDYAKRRAAVEAFLKQRLSGASGASNADRLQRSLARAL
jgi:hypothetical protein